MKAQIVASLFIACLSVICGCRTPEADLAAEAKPRTVRVETVVNRNLPVTVHSVGRLCPNREVVLSAQVPGILQDYDADVGLRVAAGLPLAKLDAADYILAVSEAEANLLAARVKGVATENNFNRAKSLLPAHVITPERYDQCEAEYKASAALVAQLETVMSLAKRRLKKTVISAPFEGHVTARFVEIGQNVAVGDPVMRLADMKTMRVKIYISELDYVHVDKDDPTTVSVEAFSQAAMTGRVDKIGIQADARTNTFEVEILVDNPDFNLKAGLTARVVIQTKVIRDAVMIPQESVLYRENRKEVFVVEGDHTAVAREVQLGRSKGSNVRILKGLIPGDRLVVAGGPYLNPGDAVVVEQ
jgi:RND family efflux transporter MFP subunit